MRFFFHGDKSFAGCDRRRAALYVARGSINPRATAGTALPADANGRRRRVEIFGYVQGDVTKENTSFSVDYSLG